MTRSIAFLGRQPALGLAELESLYGANTLTSLSPQIVQLELPPDQIDFSRLGGSLKLAKLLTKLPTTKWSELIDYLCQNIPQHLHYIPEGKLRFGLDVLGFNKSIRDINAAGLTIKRAVRQTGRSVRIVPNTAAELNSAQTLHNKLTCPIGMELALIKNGDSTLLAQITNVQDIDAYAARDQKRPKRDARVGMLPPKLAQIIINLAAGRTEVVSLLDPFCGTGVLLQEALLMGFQAHGSDIDQRMVDYSQANLDWLAQTYHLAPTFHLERADATSHTWLPAPSLIACETFLGKPLSTLPHAAILHKIVQEVNTTHGQFLQNLASQLASGSRLCLALPAWRQQQGFRHLPMLDSLGELGYTRQEFVHVRNEDLIYHRPDQIVARELVVLIKN